MPRATRRRPRCTSSRRPPLAALLLLVAVGVTAWVVIRQAGLPQAAAGVPPALQSLAVAHVGTDASLGDTLLLTTLPRETAGTPTATGRTPSPQVTPTAPATPTSGTTTPRPTATEPPPRPTPEQLARASRFAPVAFRPDAELSQRVVERLTRHSGRYGVAIKDLNTGRGVLIDPDGEYEAASLFKLAVMYEVFKQREQGALSFSESLTLTQRHAEYDLGTLDRPAGSTIELREALERMITISDNSSAILLTDRVNAFSINQDMAGLGLSHTRVRLNDLTTSPGDMLAFFEMLARGQGVNPGASAEMVHLLARQRVNDRIPRLLPAGALAAHKTGNLPGVVNDAGIVYGPDASFVIAILVDGTTDETQAARAIADLAAMAYAHFRGASGTDVQLPTQAPSATTRPTPSAPPSTETPTSTTISPSAVPSSMPPNRVEATTPPTTATRETAAPTSTPASGREALASPTARRLDDAGPSAPATNPPPTRAPTLVASIGR